MIRIIQGDCRTVLPTLESGSVQMICTSPPYYGLRSYLPDCHPDKGNEIGTEFTPADYVCALVAVFREVSRVLRDDGTVWLNIGDSYNNFRSQKGPGQAMHGRENLRGKPEPLSGKRGWKELKEKDRMMIPARVALALQNDGWYLRDEIIWHKPRPTPFPANDRTVCAHEMIYLLSKQPHYFFDWAAIEEPSSYPGLTRKAGKAFRDLAEIDPNAARERPGVEREIVVRETRRKRSVWSVSTTPYKDGHFAVMPTEIAETCIKAGSRPGDAVLDPFYGNGTTGIVADRLGRDCIGIELLSGNNDRSRDRLVRDAGMFAEFSTRCF